MFRNVEICLKLLQLEIIIEQQNFLRYFVFHGKMMGLVICCSNKSSTCDWISMFLNENGVKCVNLNGKMLRDIRTGKLNLFQSGDVDVISCTDIGSRGIDTVRVSCHIICIYRVFHDFRT